MKLNYLVMSIIIITFFISCSKPLEEECVSKVENGRLIIFHCSPRNEKWYNSTSGRIIFNKKETRLIYENLKRDLK